jgi:ribosome-binding protein aMBF1 (putative translation factor)
MVNLKNVQCSLWGKEGQLVKVKIEGAILEVCEECVKFGERIFERL